MKRIISSKAMSQIDNAAQRDFGIPGIVLMENAGLKGWQYLFDSVINKDSSRIVLFAAGPGNNGGDCLVMARHAFETYPGRVKVICLSAKLHESAAIQLNILEKMQVPVFFWPESSEKIAELVSSSSFIVDGLFGTGLDGSLREKGAHLVELLNASAAYKAAVDIPSGLYDRYKPGDPAFRAEVTLVFGMLRYAHFLPAARPICGELKVINPGFPSAVLKTEKGGLVYSFEDFNLPVFGKNAYKGTRGHLAVFAGSKGYSGAAVLASCSAAGSRTGLVTLHVDENIYQAAVSSLVSVMVRPLEEIPSDVYLKRFTSFLAGPGWGVEGRDRILHVLINSGIPGVVDADGLRVLRSLREAEGNGICNNSGNMVLTPHPGELSVLLDESRDIILQDPFTAVQKAAEVYNAVVVLKMHVVYLSEPGGRHAVVDGMNPALGSGGSGDLLSGIIAGFLAQGLDCFEAAVNGVLLHQEAGKRCFAEKGWAPSKDLIRYFPLLIKEAGY